MGNHGMLNFRVPLYVLSTVLFIWEFVPLECSKWIQELPFLLNPSCSFFNQWPWFISPPDLIAITVSVDISPVYPVPLDLAACETNAYRQYAYTS